ncbi:MAG: hypothetical protein PHF84_10065, partial [bacterium]|nr:hypothetical protein [bacterium]
VYVKDSDGIYTRVTNEYQIMGDDTKLDMLSYGTNDEEGNPVYGSIDGPVIRNSHMFNFRMRFKDLPFRYMEENITINYFGPYFKPRYSYRRIISSEQSIAFNLLFDLNPWATYRNWQIGTGFKFGESTLPRKDPYYFNNMKVLEYNIGKYLGSLGVTFRQAHLWSQNPNHPDERLNSYSIYNYIILTMKFSQRTMANLTLRDVNKKLYESGLSNIRYYGTQYTFNFKTYIAEDASVELDYIRTYPPDSDLYDATWELDNLTKVSLHVDFKF